jgi:20S proteasome alpha/beta subunit
MTTVVAVETQAGVTFAADTRVSGMYTNDGWVNKVVRNGRFGFAAAGYLRAIQVMEYAKLPDIPAGDGVTIDRFVTVELIPAILSAFADAKTPEETLQQSVILVAVAGRAYEVTYDGAWTRSPLGFLAVGSGYAFALGALANGASPKKAVETASVFDTGTNGDVRIVDVPA